MSHASTNDAFIVAVRVACEALHWSRPNTAVAVFEKDGGYLLRVIDVSKDDPRYLKVVREVVAERPDDQQAIAKLFPYQTVGDRLAFRETSTRGSRRQWVLCDVHTFKPRHVEGGMIVSGEYCDQAR